ncbi:nucleotide exchange factor GrpE [Cyanobium sp. FGCU-6]|nr:nucleotide exchange factor GrpE [Cyanobium sp. FGCU6]
MTSPRERAQQQLALRQQQQALVRDLLPVLDALDRAESHWRQSLPAPTSQGPAPAPALVPGAWPRWQRWWRRWWRRAQRSSTPAAIAPPDSPQALAQGAGEGIGLIRAQLLEALEAHGLEPIETLGQPLDPQSMQALGQRQARPGETPGVVVEEALRGYRWQGKLLREAQVLVAGP